MAYNMKGFSGFGNSSPLKQSRLLKKGKNLYETVKYRLRKSELFHPKTVFERMQDQTDTKMYTSYLKEISEGKETMESSSGYQSYRRKLYKEKPGIWGKYSGERRRRPNQPKQTIPLPEGTGKPRDTAW